MTPFEINLKHELEAEFVRMANEWFFKWHNISGEHGRVVDVPTFFGGNFHTAGIVFQGQIQELYWRSVQKYLTDKVHETFQRWDETTKTYSLELRRESLERTSVLLKGFVWRIINHGVDTDRRLRGRGFPENVEKYNASGPHSKVNAEIIRLEEGYKALLPASPPPPEPPKEVKLSGLQRFRLWAESWRGVVTLIGLLVAIAFGLHRAFFG